MFAFQLVGHICLSKKRNPPTEPRKVQKGLGRMRGNKAGYRWPAETGKQTEKQRTTPVTHAPRAVTIKTKLVHLFCGSLRILFFRFCDFWRT